MEDFYTFNEEAASNADSSDQVVLDTGVYKVKIVTASSTVASTGAKGIDWCVQLPGKKYPNMIYNMWVIKANGDRIFNMDIVDSLMGLLKIKKLTIFDKTIDTKNGKKVVKAFKELDGKECLVAIQKEFDFYGDKVKEKNNIKAFFGLDEKTYAENKGKKPAKQIKYYREKMNDNYTSSYKKQQAEEEAYVDNAADKNNEEESDEGIL